MTNATTGPVSVPLLSAAHSPQQMNAMNAPVPVNSQPILSARARSPRSGSYMLRRGSTGSTTTLVGSRSGRGMTLARPIICGAEAGAGTAEEPGTEAGKEAGATDVAGGAPLTRVGDASRVGGDHDPR